MKRFIFATLLLAAQATGVFAAACPLSKGLDATRAECLVDPAPIECTYLASMEALAGADEGASSARLRTGLAHLGTDTVEALLSRLNMMLLAAVEPPDGDPCIREMVPLLMKFLSLTIGGKETAGSSLFIGPLFYPLTDSQVKKLEERNTPEMTAQIVAARESFKKLLDRTENGRRMLSGEPLARAMELLKKIMDSGSPASLLENIPNPFSLFPKGLVSLKSLGGLEPQDETARPNEIAVLGAFKDAIDAKARGRLEEALVALKRGRKILSALPDSRKTRLLRLIGPRFAAELAKELGQRATEKFEGIEADAIKELGGLAGQILEAGMGSEVTDAQEAAMRTAAKLAEVLPKMELGQMKDLYEVVTGYMGLDALDEKMPPEKIEDAKKHFQSLFAVAECRGQSDAAACAAPHVAQAGKLEPEGRKQWLEVRAAWLGFKGGDRSPELLEKARTAIKGYEDFIDRSYQLDATLSGYLDEEVMETFRMMVDMLIGNDLSTEAFAYAEKARSWTLRRLVADGGGRRQEDETYAEHLRQATLRAAQPTNTAELEQDRLENLAFQQRLENPDLYRMPAVEATDLPAVQRSLSAGQTLLAYYFADPNRLLIWRIEADASRLAEVEATPEEWQRLTCFRQSAAAGAASRGVAMADLPCGLEHDGWSELYRLLIAPAGPDLRQELILVPHGALHQTAFAGLIGPDGERLVAGHRLTQIPSVSVWHMLAATPAAKASGPALVLGDPPGADLPGAAREAKEVAAIFGVKPFLAGDASESLVHEKTPGPALIHLAAHARYEADRPRQSGILLAASRGKKAQDGRLTALEVEETLDLRGTSLVTLSACETGVGSLTRGDELIGLTRSFLVAGSRAVLSTLWQVDDQASARLMTSFYRRLKQGGTVAGALQGAQLELAGDPATADPYYWAGYALTGDPRAELRL